VQSVGSMQHVPCGAVACLGHLRVDSCLEVQSLSTFAGHDAAVTPDEHAAAAALQRGATAGDV